MSMEAAGGGEEELVHAYMLVTNFWVTGPLFGKQVEVSLVSSRYTWEFKFMHPIHGLLCTLSDDRGTLRRLINQGLLVLPDTATLISGKCISIRYWVKIGIKRHSVEHVSQTIFSDTTYRLFLDIQSARIIPCPIFHVNFFSRILTQWKTTRQFLLQVNSSGLGLTPPEDVIKSSSSSLADHQKQGLKWMLDREEYTPVAEEDPLFPFWEQKNGMYRDCLCDFITLKRPCRITGGILADEPGMGKTLTLLSLIAYTRKTTVSHVRKRRKLMPNQERTPTLVVCPPSGVAKWKQQIKLWTTRPGALKYCTYDDDDDDTNWLMQHDLVLATYNDVNIPESVLYQVEWWRVILDDAHVFLDPMRSRSVKPHFAELKAKRRWAVTGKTVHEDFEKYPLNSLMFFFGLPLFGSLGTQPLQSKVLMEIFSLRRTMPVKSIENHLVVLSKYERDIYESVEARAKEAATSLGSELSIKSLQADVLHVWLCCNSLEISTRTNVLFESMNIQELSREPELFRKVANALQEDKGYNDCPICLDQLAVFIVTRCAHMFCGICIERVFKNWEGKSSCRCPMCRAILTKEDIFAAERGPLSLVKSSYETTSSKISYLLSLLVKSRNEDPSKKSVVLSQFQRMLKPVARALQEAGFNVKCMDVTDDAEKKTTMVEEFRDADPPVILLVTYKTLMDGISGGLDVSSNIYLMEPCWNVLSEREVLCSIHGYWTTGAKVVRLVCKDSIEERVLKLREEQTHLKQVDLSRSVSCCDPTREVQVRKYSENLQLLGLSSV